MDIESYILGSSFTSQEIAKINSNLNVNTNIIELNTSQNIILTVNTIYDVISSSVANSLLTLPTGTKTRQTIEIITSCSGFDSNNTFTISGKINGVTSNTVTIRASYVKYTFIWSESSQTWLMPLNVIV